MSSNFASEFSKLAFDPKEFFSEDFSVDEFIQRKRQSVPLDVLRDDLGIHLKSLRSSLIELINQDYAQFVNLSSNLVGLDGRIQNIVGPLQRANSDLTTFQNGLESQIDSLKSELETKKSIKKAKADLQFHRMSLQSMELASMYMQKVPSEISTDADFRLLQMACGEITETKFFLSRCTSSAHIDHLKSKWNTLCQSVLLKLQKLLQIYADTKLSADSKSLVLSLLHMYKELECEHIAENVFAEHTVKVKCNAVISRKGNFGALLEEMENFVRTCPLIVISQQLADGASSCSWMENYHFVTKALFPQVIRCLSKHFPHIWSPSAPDSFHSNWTRCLQFIEVLESCMPSVQHLEKFRNSDYYKEFISKWQFPVYFQLRFHSLAIELESALELVTSECPTKDYKLDATRVLMKVLQQCWDEKEIFISQISGRFLKASALLISRYIGSLRSGIVEANQPCLVILNSYCDANLAELATRQILTEKMELELRISSAQQNIFLGEFGWKLLREEMERKLIDSTVSASVASISSVNDMPRLFRRTNREKPSKHSDYVNNILSPIEGLKSDILNVHLSDLWSFIGSKICAQVLTRYESQIKEVLISVQRMEESLKRLKKVKSGVQNAVANNVDGNSKTLTDDDKIRLQIQLDAGYFAQKLKCICPEVDTSNIIKLSTKEQNSSS